MQAEALRVDEAVLSIPTDASVEGGLSSSFRRSHADVVPKTPHSWVRSTEDNLRNAHHWLADSARWEGGPAFKMSQHTHAADMHPALAFHVLLIEAQVPIRAHPDPCTPVAIHQASQGDPARHRQQPC